MEKVRYEIDFKTLRFLSIKMSFNGHFGHDLIRVVHTAHELIELFFRGITDVTSVEHFGAYVTPNQSD